MSYRAETIQNILVAVSYPIPLTFHSQEIPPSHRIYPLCEIVNVRPQSEHEQFDIIEETNTFEVRLLIKYNRTLDEETKDLHDIEQTMISLLKSAALSNNVEISSNFEWIRSDIRNNPTRVYGVQSTLVVSIIEIKSTSGLGNIGGRSTISLGSLTDIAFLDKPAEQETEINENVYDTARQRKALSPITDTHSFLGEIEYTKTRIDELRTLKRNRAVITGITYKRPGVADEVFTGKIVNISNGAPFNNIETIVFQIERLT